MFLTEKQKHLKKMLHLKKIHHLLSPLDRQSIGYWHDILQTEDGSNLPGELTKEKNTTYIGILESSNEMTRFLDVVMPSG